MESRTPLQQGSRPKWAIGFLSFLAIFQVIRIFAYSLIQDVLAGKYSEAWLYPAIVDVFVGVAAIFVSYLLLRRTGLAVWTVGITFFVISIADHFDAITVIAHTTAALPSFFSAGKSPAIIQLVVMSIIELLAITLLASKKLRSYYLK